MEKFSKAASKRTNGFPQAAGNFMKNLGEIINPSDFWKPFYCIWVPAAFRNCL